MQTFLPYNNFQKSAKCLDYKRLGKQRCECWQIYKALTEKDYGWKHHPIVKMWKGYECALLLYGKEICLEWKKRGYKDTMLERFQNEIDIKIKNKQTFKMPHWLGNYNLHDSHKSNLLRKNFDYYKKYNWCVDTNLDYVWILGE